MYDGTAFHGSQIQGETPTVQYHLNKALRTILRQPVETFGASRTDEGVHALCNFYHFDIDLPLTLKVLYRLNAVLPSTMSVSNIYTPANPELNARFDATTRQYRYRIYNHANPFLVNRALYYPYKIDEPLLHQTAALIKTYTGLRKLCQAQLAGTYFPLHHPSVVLGMEGQGIALCSRSKPFFKRDGPRTGRHAAESRPPDITISKASAPSSKRKTVPAQSSPLPVMGFILKRSIIRKEASRR